MLPPRQWNEMLPPQKWNEMLPLDNGTKCFPLDNGTKCFPFDNGTKCFPFDNGTKCFPFDNGTKCFPSATERNASPRQRNETLVLGNGTKRLFSATERNACSLQRNETLVLGNGTKRFPSATERQQKDTVCMDPEVMSYSQTIYMTGLLLGSLFGGALSDRYGKRAVLLVCVCVNAVTAVLPAVLPQALLFLTLRCLAGVSCCCINICSFSLGVEWSLPRYRIWPPALLSFSFSLGMMALAPLAYLTHTWTQLHLALAVPQILCLPLYYCIPESPRWLLLKRRTETLEQYRRHSPEDRRFLDLLLDTEGKDLQEVHLNTEGKDLQEVHLNTEGKDLQEVHLNTEGKDLQEVHLNTEGKDLQEVHLNTEGKDLQEVHLNTEGKDLQEVHLNTEGKDLQEVHLDTEGKDLQEVHLDTDTPDNKTNTLETDTPDNETHTLETDTPDNETHTPKTDTQTWEEHTLSHCGHMRSPTILLRLVILSYIGLASALTYYGICMNVGRFGVDVFLAQFFSGLSEAPCLLVPFLLARWGRRPISMLSLFLSGSFCLLSLLASRFYDVPGLVMTLALVGKLCMQTTVFVSVLYGIELFPTLIRQKCVGLVCLCYRVGCILNAVVSPRGETIPLAAMILYGSGPIVGAGLCLFLPETSGVPLPDSLEDCDKQPSLHLPTFPSLWSSEGAQRIPQLAKPTRCWETQRSPPTTHRIQTDSNCTYTNTHML
ncbi:solute carrier family 22 member 6-like isoform X3 [Salvelinus namaycush]|uniref:Solute carrier family 22 member 6-like isoform X3 n=1 Tax=Salvelinus namaycush TaxID=8040 RepID=A0A8U0TN75_SALNM|nr:solute carrier family 22 member 6-like isoform X3 [Salvelinus namaycush]